MRELSNSHVLFLVQGQGYNLYSKEGIDMVRNVLFTVSLVLFFSPLSSQVRGDTTLTSFTRFPHQDSTRSVSEAFPVVLPDQSILLFWADSTGIRSSKSSDRGQSWNTPVLLATPARFAVALTGIRTFAGRFLVFWRDSLGIRLTQSDDALNWSVPVSLGTSFGGLSVSQTLDGKIWLFVIRITSTDNGFSWSPPDTVIIKGGRPRIARTSNGTMVMVYEKQRTDSIPLYYSALDICYSTSTDGGFGWSSPVQATRFVGNDMSHNVAMLNDKPLFTFASDRGRTGPAWETIQKQIWYGIIGESLDESPPPILLSASSYHTLSGLENWIQALVDDEAGIASVLCTYSIDGVPQPPVYLHDDGRNFDVSPGDNIWGSPIPPLSVGTIEARFTITDVEGIRLNNALGFTTAVTEPSASAHVTQGTSMKVVLDGRGVFGRAVFPNNYAGIGLRYLVNSTIEHLYGAGIWIGGMIDTTSGGTGQKIKRVSTAYEVGPVRSSNFTSAPILRILFGECLAGMRRSPPAGMLTGEILFHFVSSRTRTFSASITTTRRLCQVMCRWG